MWWTSIVCVLFLSAVSCNPVVNIAKGAIRGQTLKSRDGREYQSFSGIPFAKPPVGELRFKPPQPVDPWDGVLDATVDPPMCIQNNYFFPAVKDVIQGQEDCLYLNVHSPDLDGKLPVMFWIHGGGFFAGHGGPGLYGADYFMDKDVVLVSFNYRLGLLGFVSTEDDALPGNYGMKDQVAALRWVRDNVASFGGDAGRVTVFGESAGSVSAGYHMMSPMSKGLFHRAILESGTPTCNWAISTPGVARKRAEAIATLAGCYGNGSGGVLDCLNRQSATRLVELHDKFLEWLTNPCISFPPVVEPCDSNEEAFLCNHPITNFKQESVVSTMIGFNSGEGGLIVAPLFNDTSLIYPELQTNFNQLIASVLVYKHLSLPEDWDEIGNRIMKMYFPSGKIDSPLKTVDMMGEGTFLRCVLGMSIKLSPPVYLYLFDYQNEFTFNSLYGGYPKSLGVSHGDEMISLFPLKEIKPKELNENDRKVSNLMVDIWVKFASFESPTVDGTNDGAAWPEFSSIEDSSLLHIHSDNPEIVKNPFAEKFKFWSELPMLSRLLNATAGSQQERNVKTEL